MDQEIKIIAEPQPDGISCRFNLEKPLYLDGGTYMFNSKEKAKGSAIAEALFEVKDVSACLVSGAVVIVTKEGTREWSELGPEIGKAIRKGVQSGNPLVAKEVINKLPDPEVLKQKIHQLLGERVNPSLAGHGGFIEILEIRKNDLYVRMGGGCHGCAASSATLKYGVERILREEIPEIGMIYDTTDHASGTNPYYRS